MAKNQHGTVGSEEIEDWELQGGPFQLLEVMNVDGAGRIYFRVDGEDPEVEGNDCEVVPAAVGAALCIDPGDATAIKMIATATTAVCVRGV